MRLAGKVTLITGAAQGIGAATARRFASEGAAVFIADVKAAEGQALAAELDAKGNRAWFLLLDVRSESDWARALETVAAHAGRLDVLLCNAGVNIREPIEQMSEASLDTMLAVNIKGTFLGIKHALPLLRRGGGGTILITSSIAGLVGHRYTTEAYTMAKGALTLLTRDPQRRAERLAEVPLGRMASVDDVASAFVYLASDEAAFINGVALPVDGGLTAG
ncbi:MAG: SDR family NAD(P)-dependent oxidoreductase [Spirochaetes bacterium]|nr:SDR family NAD(P)-dependent oxidoreductase [Spirochaetota bacterium]